MMVLGIESSCDETAAAVVSGGREILSSVVLSQIEHAAFGGVVPEIAARSHLEHIDRIVADALAQAGIGLAQVDAVAAAAGPGLIGGVSVGVMAAKALALATGKPFLAINHLEGHALMARLTNEVEFPYLLLLVSGGHCQILAVRAPGSYERLGTTIDDAAGEAFDKVAKMLGLGYPGGPKVDKAALAGDAARFALPRPMLHSKDCLMSFSGLKTAARKVIEDLGGLEALSEKDICDICASFQAAISDVLAGKTARAAETFKRKYPGGKDLVVSGGVAANACLRGRLQALADAEGLVFSAPPLKLCTDNGAMIAWAGVERFRLGMVDGLDFAARPRWPLDESAASSGAKA